MRCSLFLSLLLPGLLLLACVSQATVQFNVASSSSIWYLAVLPLNDGGATTAVQIKDDSLSSFVSMTFNAGWNYYSYSSISGRGFVFPVTILMISNSGAEVSATLQSIVPGATIDTGSSYGSASVAVSSAAASSAASSSGASSGSPGGSQVVSGHCTGTPRMLNGKPCASTTRYWDGNLGACGCGASSSAGAFPWVGAQYTAAASPPLFGPQSDCGTGCGKCYQLTATGYSPQGRGATSGQSIVIMITNLCPSGGQWCADNLNSFNYSAHFDLADNPASPLISNLGWDNAEVVYEQVACNGVNNSPTTQEFDQCYCPNPSY